MRLLTLMGLVALVLATATSVAATGRLTLSLLLSGIVCWSFVPALQLLTGLLLLRGTGAAQVPALERYFATHRSWSFWLLLASAVLLLSPHPGGALVFILPTTFIPAALTARALYQLSREALGDAPARARRRVALHQAATLVLVLIYTDLSVALWPRIVAVLAR